MTRLCRLCSTEKVLAAFCANGVGAQRRAVCRACHASREQRLRAKNPESVKATKRRSRAKRKTQERAYRIRYYEANRERILERNRLDMQRWRGRNRQRHRDNARNGVARRRVRLREQAVETVDYSAVYVRDNGTCYLCGHFALREEVHFDHVVPLARGGAHSYENVRVAHALCNLRKGCRPLQAVRA